MPNEESPVENMEVTIEASQSQINDLRNGEKMAPIVPPSAEVVAEELKNIGNVEYAKKDYKKAIEFYTQAIDACPTASYYGNRAAAHVMLSQFAKALEDARRSTLIDPTFTKGYLREAKCQLALGEVVAAAHLYEKVIEREPGNVTAQTEHKQAKYVQGLLTKSDLSFQKGDYRTVIFNMDRCIETCSHCSKFKILKAECFVLLKRYTEAQNLASDVLRLDGLCADAIYVRGLCLYYTDVYDKAFQHFQEVLRIAPDHIKARNAYRKAKLLKSLKEDGNRAYKSGKYCEAEAKYKEALNVDPHNVQSNAKIYYNLAMVSNQLKRHEDCAQYCTNAIQLDKFYTKAYLRRAQCYTELEMFEEAVREYEAILKFDKSREMKAACDKAKLRLKKSKRKDYYKILNVKKDATEDEIKKAYKKNALLHHPDRHSNATDEIKKEQEMKFKEVGEAYSVLSDPKKKPLYDSGHDLEEINNGGAGFNGPSGPFDPDLLFQSFFGQSQRGGGGGAGFPSAGFQQGGFPGFSFHFG